jgi:ABC-type branched-subunit amino acid transport system ATPase component/ABC-type branched-subunit amino acid transport system permease subunit
VLNGAELFRFLLLGLASGGVYALLALGVVLVHRGSGIVNFAAGGFALLSGGIYYYLSQDEALPWGLSAVIAILASAILGALTHQCIMRPMRQASTVMRAMATLGVLAAIQGVADERIGVGANIIVPVFLPNTRLTIFGADIQLAYILVFAIATLLCAGLWVAYRYTRFGIATTAVGENPLITSAQGWSPDLVATVNWAIGGALSGLAGVLIVPFVGLSSAGLTFVIVPALAAALVGGFASFPLTLLGGLLIGVVGSEGLLLQANGSIPVGWSDALPFLVIVVLLVVRGKGVPGRGERSARLPKVASGRISVGWILFGSAVLIGSLQIFTVDWTTSVITFLGYALLCLSVVIVTGYGGQLSLANVGFAGLGALFAGRTAAVFGLSFIPALLIGVAATAIIGMLVALPAVRVRGVSLAIVTLAVGEIIDDAVLSNPSYTGGPFKGTVVSAPSIFGYSVYSVNHPQRYAIVGLVLFVLAGLLVANLRRSRSGRKLLAVRSNERAALSVGIPVVGMKLYAFGVSAALAGVGGIYLAFQNEQIDFNQFNSFESITLVLYTAIGGIGSIAGSLIGAVGTTGSLAPQAISDVVNVTGWFPPIAAVLLILVLITHPDGVADVAAKQWRALTLRRTGWLQGSKKHAELVELPIVRRERVAPRSLQVRDVSVAFGGITALDHVTFDVGPGEVVGIIGPNGAGKTTLIDVISGFQKAGNGSVMVDDEVIDGRSSPQRARLGVSRSFQNLELFEDLTIGENLRVASEPHAVRSYFYDLLRPGTATLSPAALAAISEFELGGALESFPTEVPYAQRRLVAIARSVATSPSILLLDEPAAGLDERSREELAGLIRRLADDWGMGIVLIEHDVGMVLGTCDRVVALNFGAVVAVGTPEEIRGNSAVVDSYLGTTAEGLGVYSQSPDAASAS